MSETVERSNEIDLGSRSDENINTPLVNGNDNVHNDAEEEDNSSRTQFREPSRENVLDLFSKAATSWSLYYSVDILAKEAEERAKNAKPLLTPTLKSKLAERRQAKSLAKLDIKTENTSDTLSGSVVNTRVMNTPTPRSSSNVPTSTTVITAEGSDSDSDEVEFEYETTYDNNGNLVIDLNEDAAESASDDEDTAGVEEGIIDLGDSHLYDHSDIKTKIPWVKRKYEGPTAIRLHQEIVDFYEFMRESPAERAVRDRVFAIVVDVCRSIDPNCVVELFGSFPSDLMIRGSDLDVHVRTRTNSEDFLHLFANAIESRGLAKNEVEKVFTARIPIVKFYEKDTCQHIDVSCNNDNDVNIAVQTVNEFVDTYPAFKYLALLIKHFLRQRGLNEVFKGGLSSFGMSILIVSHLQMHACNISEEDAKITTLGTLLLDFFALYGIYFNYRKVGIDVSRDGAYYNHMTSPFPPARNNHILQLFVTDPNNSVNNITKGTHNVAGIRHAFQHAFQALTADEAEFPEEDYQHSILARIIDVTSDDYLRRVEVHSDQKFKSYCSANSIPLRTNTYSRSQRDHRSGKKRKYPRSRDRSRDKPRRKRVKYE